MAMIEVRGIDDVTSVNEGIYHRYFGIASSIALELGCAPSTSFPGARHRFPKDVDR